MKREAGILMPIASLPNKHGIGDFGPQTYRFIDNLKDANITYWQILPLNRLSYGNSPYQPLSSHAIDEIYISLDKKMVLLKYLVHSRKKNEEWIMMR